MKVYPFILFGSAAVMNFAVAAGLTVFLPQFVRVLELDPITGSNVAIAGLAGALIAALGGAYLCVAFDPVGYRPFIGLGALGKGLAFFGLLWSWREGQAPWTLPALGLADALYVLLFVAYLRRPGPRSRTRRSSRPR